jgi:hypothetical protein
MFTLPSSVRVFVATGCPLDDPLVPWAELHGKRYPLHVVDRVANSQRKRPLRRPDEPSSPLRQTDFDQNRPLLEQAVGRDPSRRGGEP